MQELWQLYDEQANPLPGKGATKDEVFKGLLHGAAHVWLYRWLDGRLQILVQRRAADKRTWPNLLDISAAGHIDLGEDPQTAALRETQEEIGMSIQATDLQPVTRLRAHMVAPDGSIENEFRWVYTLEIKTDQDFTLQTKEVASLEWKDFAVFCQEVRNNNQNEQYVPQKPDSYYETLITFLQKLKQP